MFTNGSRYHWGPHRFLRHPTHGAVGSWALSSFCRSIFSVSLFKAKMAPFDRPLSSQRGRPFETEKDQGDSWGIENWDYSHTHIYIYTGLYLYHSYIIINYSICITYIITYIYIYIWFELIWDHQICHILCCFISRWNHSVRPWRPRLTWHRRPEFVPKNAIVIDGLWCLSIGLWWLMLVHKMVRKKSKSWLSLFPRIMVCIRFMMVFMMVFIVVMFSRNSIRQFANNKLEWWVVLLYLWWLILGIHPENYWNSWCQHDDTYPLVMSRHSYWKYGPVHL